MKALIVEMVIIDKKSCVVNAALIYFIKYFGSNLIGW